MGACEVQGYEADPKLNRRVSALRRARRSGANGVAKVTLMNPVNRMELLECRDDRESYEKSLAIAEKDIQS